MIYVKAPGIRWRPDYHQAHLRNKRGYVYLVWREGRRVRSYYLGKAPRRFSYAASSPAAVRAGQAAGELVRPGRSSVGQKKGRLRGS